MSKGSFHSGVLGLYVCFSLCFPSVWLAATPLAPHVTQDELERWQVRKDQAPYRDAWDRILNRANVLQSHPDISFWPGNQTNDIWDGDQVVTGHQPPNAQPHRELGDHLRDAGLVYLLTGDLTYRNQVRQALLNQASSPGTQFANAAKWDPVETSLGHGNVQIANWLRKLCYGYSYIRATLPAPDQKTIDQWFLEAARFWDSNSRAWIDDRFPGRWAHPEQFDPDDDDGVAEYQHRSSPYNPGEAMGVSHRGGYMTYTFQKPWLNHPAAHNALVAAVGVMLDDYDLKRNATLFVKEWLMFAVAADGTVAEQHRWKLMHDPEIGYADAGTGIGSVVTIADHLARAGDPALYEYETRFGYDGWEGGLKSLRRVVQRFADLTLGGSDLGGGVQIYTPDGQRFEPGDKIHAIQLIPANLYYRDPTLTRSYTRPLPQSPWNEGYDPWGGDWGTYSDIQFLFGLHEDEIWPYPTPKPPREQKQFGNRTYEVLLLAEDYFDNLNNWVIETEGRVSFTHNTLTLDMLGAWGTLWYNKRFTGPTLMQYEARVEAGESNINAHFYGSIMHDSQETLFLTHPQRTGQTSDYEGFQNYRVHNVALQSQGNIPPDDIHNWRIRLRTNPGNHLLASQSFTQPVTGDDYQQMAYLFEDDGSVTVYIDGVQRLSHQESSGYYRQGHHALRTWRTLSHIKNFKVYAILNVMPQAETVSRQGSNDFDLR